MSPASSPKQQDHKGHEDEDVGQVPAEQAASVHSPGAGQEPQVADSRRSSSIRAHASSPAAEDTSMGGGVLEEDERELQEEEPPLLIGPGEHQEYVFTPGPARSGSATVAPQFQHLIAYNRRDTACWGCIHKQDHLLHWYHEQRDADGSLVNPNDKICVYCMDLIPGAPHLWKEDDCRCGVPRSIVEGRDEVIREANSLLQLAHGLPAQQSTASNSTATENAITSCHLSHGLPVKKSEDSKITTTTTKDLAKDALSRPDLEVLDLTGDSAAVDEPITNVFPSHGLPAQESTSQDSASAEKSAIDVQAAVLLEAGPCVPPGHGLPIHDHTTLDPATPDEAVTDAQSDASTEVDMDDEDANITTPVPGHVYISTPAPGHVDFATFPSPAATSCFNSDAEAEVDPEYEDCKPPVERAVPIKFLLVDSEANNEDDAKPVPQNESSAQLNPDSSNATEENDSKPSFQGGLPTQANSDDSNAKVDEDRALPSIEEAHDSAASPTTPVAGNKRKLPSGFDRKDMKKYFNPRWSLPGLSRVAKPLPPRRAHANLRATHRARSPSLVRAPSPPRLHASQWSPTVQEYIAARDQTIRLIVQNEHAARRAFDHAMREIQVQTRVLDDSIEQLEQCTKDFAEVLSGDFQGW